MSGASPPNSMSPGQGVTGPQSAPPKSADRDHQVQRINHRIRPIRPQWHKLTQAIWDRLKESQHAEDLGCSTVGLVQHGVVEGDLSTPAVSITASTILPVGSETLQCCLGSHRKRVAVLGYHLYIAVQKLGYLHVGSEGMTARLQTSASRPRQNKLVRIPIKSNLGQGKRHFVIIRQMTNWYLQ